MDFWIFLLAEEEREDLLRPEWIMNLSLNAVLTCDLVRRTAGQPEAEYGIELEIARTQARQLRLWHYGDSPPLGFEGYPLSAVVLPRLTFVNRTEFADVIATFDRDLWNSAGVEPRFPLEVQIPDAP